MMAEINPFTKQKASTFWLEIKEQWKNLPAQKKQTVTDLRQLLKDKRLLLLTAATGAGKSTQVPKHVIQHYFDEGKDRPKILCTQPRREASRKLAERLVDETGLEQKRDIGYQYRGENMTSSKTILSFVTDGLLVNRLIKDPKASGIDCIIVDEAHERSVNIDILLVLLRRILRDQTSQVKIIIMSATFQMDLFMNYFKEGLKKPNNSIGLIDIEGRAYPVESRWPVQLRDYRSDKPVDNSIYFKVISEITKGNNEKGDVLIFLPTRRRIVDLHEAIERKFPTLLVLDLYAGLPRDRMDAATNPDKKGRRKVVLSTNVAETSLTIRGIVYVVDSGREIKRSYVPDLNAYEIRDGHVSKANVAQRKGRGGRTQPGVCYHMYPKSSFDSWPDYASPEIESEDIASTYLSLSSSFDTVKKIDSLLDEMIQPPHPSFRKAAKQLLWWNKALQVNPQGDIVASSIGKLLRQFPTKPAAAMLILAGNYYGVRQLSVKLAALLDTVDNLNSIFLPPPPSKNKKKKVDIPKLWNRCKVAGSDHLTLLKLYLTFEMHRDKETNWCKRHRLRYKKLIEVKKLEKQILMSNSNRYPEDLENFETIKGGKSKDRQIAKLPHGCEDALLKSLCHAYGGRTAIVDGDGLIVEIRNGDDALSLRVKPERSSVVSGRACDPCIFSELVVSRQRWRLSYITSRIKRKWIRSVTESARQYMVSQNQTI